MRAQCACCALRCIDAANHVRGLQLMGTTFADPGCTLGPPSIEYAMHTFTSAAHASQRTHGTLSRLAAGAALAALLGASWQTCRTVHQRRMSERPSAKPQPEQVWEGEGGQSQMPKSAPP
jgi:hypothetical protein